jgi:hypothetical protein
MDYNLNHLLANPYHLKNKKKKKQINLHHELFTLFTKLYPDLHLYESIDQPLFIQKIENLYIDFYIEKFVHSIIQDVIHEFN